MKRLLLSLILMLVGSAAVGHTKASAHAAAPLQEQTVQAGPYKILVSFYALPRTDTPASVTFSPVAGSPVFSHIDASMVPSGNTNSLVRPLQVIPDRQDGPGVQQAIVTANVAGAWTLRINADGPSGKGSADTPVQVAGPPEMPIWLGWVIGLSPLVFGILFVTLQVLTMRRRGTLAPMPQG